MKDFKSVLVGPVTTVAAGFIDVPNLRMNDQ
jgi:hypothetical protein